MAHKLPEEFQNISEKAKEAIYQAFDSNHADLLLISEDKVKLSVHKCVLVARMEYFKLMFANAWQEKKVKELHLQVDSSILRAFIDVMYTGGSSFFYDQNLEVLTLALKKADEFMYEEFRVLIQKRLKELVSFRNVVKLIKIAHQYNAEILLNYVHQFIHENLSTFLEKR